MIIRWSTVIQIKEGRRWVFFSQQSWKEAQYTYEAGEMPMSDADYLAACRELEPKAELRIAPSAQEEHGGNAA